VKTLVLYHDQCTDGFGAAYAAWALFGSQAKYVPVQYGKINSYEDFESRFGPVNELDIHILDFSFPKPLMDALVGQAGKITWLDHHKTAFESWLGKFESGMTFESQVPEEGEPLVHIVLDDNRSGALIAWNHYHVDRPVPWLISHIDDRDRWVFALGGSREIYAAMSVIQPWSFEQWHNIVVHGYRNAMITNGQAILTAFDIQIKKAVSSAKPATIRHPSGAQCSVMCVNSPVHQSEIGYELCKKYGSAALIWYYDGNTGRANCSLRSVGDFDVSAVAKAFGGGGHKNASGFNIDMSTLLSWLATVPTPGESS